MTPTSCASLFALAALVLSNGALPCEAPKPGYSMDRDELISKASTIVLVRLKSSAASPENKRWTKYTLETVEIIKGRPDRSYTFSSMGSNESDNDFAAHTAKEFWDTPVGRSEWPCCICGPDHTFRDGRSYLYFPDKLGAMKSAEVIHGESDRWLQYVRSEVKMAANRALQGTR